MRFQYVHVFQICLQLSSAKMWLAANREILGVPNKGFPADAEKRRGLKTGVRLDAKRGTGHRHSRQAEKEALARIARGRGCG